MACEAEGRDRSETRGHDHMLSRFRACAHVAPDSLLPVLTINLNNATALCMLRTGTFMAGRGEKKKKKGSIIAREQGRRCASPYASILQAGRRRTF